LVIRRPIRERLSDTTTAAAWGVALTFMALCLAYQWPSTRFTTFFWPFLVLALFRTIAGRPQAAAPHLADLAALLAAGLVLLQTLLLTPSVPDAPYLRTVRLDASRSWLVQFGRARPLDRMDLAARCGSRSAPCAEARPLVGLTPYQEQILAFYE